VFVAIAIHHPHPDHVDAFLAHMERVIETVGDADGLLEFRAMRDESTGRLLGFSRWRSRADFEAALPLIQANAHRREPEWTVADDELLLLAPA
jgi:quinol monooxygenase YgiN